MKPVCFRFLFGVLIICSFLPSCSIDDSSDIDQKIENIWCLSDTDLDSAVTMTIELGDSVRSYGDMTRMKYDLLCVRLRDKQNILPSSADSMKVIMEYFEKSGSSVYKMRSYHYLSSVYRDLHDRPSAILYDLKAVEEAKKENSTDSAMLEKIYSQLSFLYRQQFNMSKSIEMAIKHYEVSSDKIWAAMDIASAYYSEDDYEKSQKFYLECYANLVNDTLFKYHPGLHSELLARYSSFGIMGKADSLYALLSTLPESSRPQNYNSAVGEYFVLKNMKDSAMTYYKSELESSHSIGYRCDAAYSLMNCYDRKGEVDSIAKYSLIFAQLNDSVIAERKFDQTRNADAEYRYQRNAEEEKEILQRNESLRKRNFAVTVILIVILMGGGIVYFYRRKRVLELILQKDEQIENYSVEIKKKQDALELAMKSKEALDLQLSNLYQQIEKKKIQNATLLQLALMRKTEDNAKEVIEKFKKASIGQHPLDNDEWKELMAAIDGMYPTFKSILQNKIPKLSKPIIQTAYMMKAGMSNPQIANLMNIPRQTVWYRSNAIRKALGEDLQIDLDTMALE